MIANAKSVAVAIIATAFTTIAIRPDSIIAVATWCIGTAHWETGLCYLVETIQALVSFIAITIIVVFAIGY